jgi:chromosome segregation ATPase
LFEDIQIINKEKERFLIDINNVEENNIELQKLVASVHTERDSLSLRCGQLSAEKERITKQLESGKVEKKTVTNENGYLKSENERLNHHLDNVNKKLNTVRNENHLLKIENQQFSEKFHSVLNDREKLTSKLQHAKCQLQNILQQTHSNLQHCSVYNSFAEEKQVDGRNEDKDDDGDLFYKHSSSLSDIISSLDKNLTQFFSLKTDELNPVHSTSGECNNQVEQETQANSLSDLKNDIQSVFLCDEPNNKTRISADIISRGKDDLRKLYSELKLLNIVISNLEAEGELLQAENTKLRESMNCLMKLNSEGMLLSQENCLEALLINSRMVVDRSSEVDDVNIHLKKDSAREVVQLQNELDICQKSLEIKTLEICQLKKKLDEQIAQISETDSDLRNELDCCRQTLSKKITELELVQEELAFVLGKQSRFGSEEREVDRICSKMTQCHKCSEDKIGELGSAKYEFSVLYEQQHNSQLETEKLQDELTKMTEAFLNTSALMKSLNGEKTNLEFSVDVLQNELIASKESKAYLESCLDSLHKEKAAVEQELTSIKQGLLMKSVGMEELKEKETEVACYKENADDTIPKLDEKIHKVPQEFSGKFVIEGTNIELEELKKQIMQYEREKTDLINENTKLSNMLVDFKSVVDQNAMYVRSKNSETEAIKEENPKVDGEWIKLHSEFEGKCRLLNKKETMIRSIRQALVDVDTSLKTIGDELLKNETQNYKFFVDEKCREDEVAKQLEHITLNSLRNSVEASSKASSEFQATVEVKDKRTETLKTTLQQAESNISQTLIMLKDLEGELLNVQNHYGSLKTEFSDLKKLLDTRTLELSNLHTSFEEKCLELGSVKNVSQIIASELEILKNTLVQSELSYKKAENQLKEQLDVTNGHYNNSVTELITLKKQVKQFESNKIQLQNELVDVQEQYSIKMLELERVAKEFDCLQSQFIQTQEELKMYRNQHDDVVKELKYVKNALQLANNKHREIEEELVIAKNRCDEKTKEVGDLTSELVNVQNASAEAVDHLIAVTTELETVKDVHLMSTGKLDETTEQLRDVTIKLTMKEEELKDSLKQLEVSEIYICFFVVILHMYPDTRIRYKQEKLYYVHFYHLFHKYIIILIH